MRGLPGSGKTKRAKELSIIHHSSRIISADDYFTDDFGEYRFNPNLLIAAHNSCKEIAINSMQFGSIPLIILDNTNTRKWEFQFYLDLASIYDYQVYFEYPNSEWWLDMMPRMKNKEYTKEDIKLLESKCTHSVPFKSIAIMADRFEF